MSTKVSPRWNGLFAASRPSICTFDRSSIGRRRAYALTSFCACSPITSSGICANALPRCSYDDADKVTAEALRTSVVAKAQRSPSAIAKQTLGTTPDGLPVHSLQTLLADLATLARNTVTTALNPAHEFLVHTRPTKLQQKALDLLAINPATCTQ